MKRVMVIGSPGAGKSTFSKKLAEITGLPLFHIDLMFWNEDKTIVEEEVFLGRLKTAMQGESWILDGNYESTLPMRMEASDTIVFLDLPVELCLQGIHSRLGLRRSDMPWFENNIDQELVDFVEEYPSLSKPQIIEMLERYRDREILIFRDRSDMESFLQKLKR